VSAGFALRLGSALDGATNPLLLIALHERSVLFLTCNDACSEEFAAVSAWLCKAPESGIVFKTSKPQTQQATMSKEQTDPCKMQFCACSNLNSSPACIRVTGVSSGSADHAGEPQRTLT